MGHKAWYTREREKRRRTQKKPSSLALEEREVWGSILLLLCMSVSPQISRNDLGDGIEKRNLFLCLTFKETVLWPEEKISSQSRTIFFGRETKWKAEKEKCWKVQFEGDLIGFWSAMVIYNRSHQRKLFFLHIFCWIEGSLSNRFYYILSRIFFSQLISFVIDCNCVD